MTQIHHILTSRGIRKKFENVFQIIQSWVRTHPNTKNVWFDSYVTGNFLQMQYGKNSDEFSFSPCARLHEIADIKVKMQSHCSAIVNAYFTCHLL
jgi:hypothetical protein